MTKRNAANYNGDNWYYRGGKPALASGVLRAVLKKHGLDNELERYNFINHWEEIVGKDIASRTKPMSIRNGMLTIGVVDSIWAQELSFQKRFILYRLKPYLSARDKVRDVRFRVMDLK